MDTTLILYLLLGAIAIFFAGKEYGKKILSDKLINSIGTGSIGNGILVLNGETDVHFSEGEIVSIKNKEIALMQKLPTSSV